ncbi:mechanosensitive ion channel family protein [Catenulispora pinisilvae]|uniref:mechanosensitive ion channel family protein n=1 Tax=Catenulispora pinisilvae TaxID=2705253 RepID=UPI001890E6F8|nr:mechanosensitive ion channel domain-containing protein [Catenulispora pinisilvae]
MSAAVSLIAAAHKSPASGGPSTPPPPDPTGDLTTRVAKASNWFSDHSGVIISDTIAIVSIIVVSLLIRKVTLTFIRRTVEKAAMRAESKPGRFLENGLLMGAERRMQRTRALGGVLGSIASVTIMIIAALMIIQQLHISTGPILASVGGLSVAIGFGARDVVTDLLAGIFMIMEDQYGVGDFIDAGDAKGTVEEVGLRVTQLRDIDGVVWYVRNGTIKRIGNQSQGHARAIVDVPVSYTENPQRVRDVMVESAHQLFEDPMWKDSFLSEAPTVAGIESIEGDHMMMRVSMRTAPRKSSEVARELRSRLLAAFDESGVKVGVTAASGTNGAEDVVSVVPQQPVKGPSIG